MKNSDDFTGEESEFDEKDDTYEDYNTIKQKHVRWQRLFGWAIILYAVSNLAFVPITVFYLSPDIIYKSDIVMMVLLNIVILIFNVFLINVGIKKIKKNRKNYLN